MIESFEKRRLGSRCVEIWEPLATKAPGPHLTQPYCCYARTVIFYVRGYILRPWHTFWRGYDGKLQAQKPGGQYEKWDEVETALNWNDPVEFEGATYEVGGGRVVWRGKRWYMRCLAFLKEERCPFTPKTY